MKNRTNKFSSLITQNKSQGASQAMLFGVGLTEADMDKPQVGISSMWYEGNTCNMHLNGLADKVAEGVVAAELISMRFNTIGVSDGMSNGTPGMSFSLPSRDIIADSIETVMNAQCYDANISIPGCDKNMPGCMIAIGRLNRPSLMIYGGTIRSGRSPSNEKLDIISAFQSYGKYIKGTIDDAERMAIVKSSCPGAGACGGMYTANTMACAIEAMGMSLPYSSSTPANDPAKLNECFAAGAAIKNLLECDIKPRDIMTRKAFENAITITLALGGSTNAVLHLIAMARSVDVPLELDDFQALSDRTPYLADLRPSGSYLMEDLHAIGGTPAVLKYLLQKGYIHGDCLTVTGKTLEENLAICNELSAGQQIIFPVEDPITQTGHLKILKGNLAPEGAVAKITGKEGSFFSGPAQTFDSEETMLTALTDGKINRGSVIVIRYEGPKGGPGMPEMLKPTSVVMGAGLGNEVALITDGRFSGGSHGFIVGHITPEAQLGGPIALVQDGDIIRIDASNKSIDVLIDADVLQQRRSTWIAPSLKANKGALFKYIKSVGSAANGCVTDE